MITQLSSYKMFLAPLLQCLTNDGVKTPDNKSQATVLTVTAADCFSSLAYALSIASYNALMEDQDESEELMGNSDVPKGMYLSGYRFYQTYWLSIDCA